MEQNQKEALEALLARINRLGSGGADSLAVDELKELSSRCSEEFAEELAAPGEPAEDTKTEP